MYPPKLYLCSMILALTISGCSAEKTSTDYIQSALKYSDSGEHNSAVIEARNAVKLDSNNAEARQLLGKLELRIVNYQASEKELRKAIELGTPTDDVLLVLSQALLKQKKYDEVLKLDSETAPDNTKVKVLAHKAAAHFALGNFVTADKMAASSLELDSGSAEALLVMANLAAHKNEPELAREHISTVLKASPDNADAWELLGQLETQAQKLDQAVVAYSNAIEHGHDVLTPLLSRSQLYIQLQKYDEAKEDFTTIEKAGVKHPTVYQGRSEILFQKGKYHEAQVLQEKALKLNPDYLPAVRGIALIHLVLGNLGQAEQYAKQLLSANESVDARVLLGAIRLENERYEQAETTLAPLVASGSLDLISTRILSTAYLKQDKLDEAVDLAFNTHRSVLASGVTDVPFLALSRRPALVLVNQAEDTNPEEQPYLSKQYSKIVETTSLVAGATLTEALAAIDELQTQMPDSAIPHNLRGRAFLLSADFKNAKTSFEKAISLSSNDSSLVIMLAEIARQDNPEEATVLLESALRDATGSVREKLMLTLATHSDRNNNPSAVLVWLNRAKAENPESIQTNFALAQYHLATGNNSDALDAIASMDKAGQFIPHVAELQLNSMIRENHIDDAINLLDNLVQRSPHSPNWYFMRAQAYAGKEE